MKYLTKSAKQTEALGKKFVTNLKQGGVFGLIGDLGAGKTAFVKGVAKGLSIKSRITSPTFVLMRVYPVIRQGRQAKNKHIKRLVHVDAYRVKKAVYLSGIGLEDYLSDPETLVLIEWADQVRSIMPRRANMIYFKYRDLSSREISL